MLLGPARTRVPMAKEQEPQEPAPVNRLVLVTRRLALATLRLGQEMLRLEQEMLRLALVPRTVKPGLVGSHKTRSGAYSC